MAQESVDLSEKTVAGRSLPALTGLVLFLAVTLYIQAPFLTSERLYFHDSFNALTAIGLFYDRLIGGASWLWAAEMNAGHPLWMMIESAPFLDPVAMVVYLVSSALHTNWFLPYQVTCFLWLLIFSFGGAMCAQQLMRSQWSAVLTFLLLFGGPLAIMSPAQSWGFLIPLRYLPWIVWFYMRLRTHVVTPNVAAFSAISTISLAGYQSAYLLFAMVLLMIAEVVMQRRDYFRWLGQLLRVRYLVWLVLPVLAALPTLAYLQYSNYLVIVPRAYAPQLVYMFEGAKFIGDLFFTWSSLFEDGINFSGWHGTTYFGILTPVLIVHAVQRVARSQVRTGPMPSEGKMPATLVVWLIMTSIVACGGLGLSEHVLARGSLLGIRNFGFLLTGSLFVLALLAAFGFSEILKNGCSLTDAALDITLFVILTVIYYWQIGPAETPAVWLATSLAVYVSATVVLFLLHRLCSTRAMFAGSVILLIATEVLVTTSSAIPSLRDYIADKPTARDVGKALAKSPRLAQGEERFQLYRSLDLPISETWPLVLAAPAISKRSVARLPAILPYDLGVGLASHYFRLRAYEKLVTDHFDPGTIEAVLGVTRPILELVPQSALAIDEAGGLRLVLQDDSHKGESPDLRSLAGEIGVSEFAGDRVAAEIDSPAQAVLVYRDNMAPGWSVTVDGKDAELLVVDGVNKAVAVPPGRHVVEFIYRPWPYLIAFALRALAMIVAVGVCFGFAVYAHRNSS